MSIATYNPQAQAPINYAKPQDFTAKVKDFAQHLHAFLPTLEAEFNDLEKKAQTKPCKAFDDKMASLSAIYNAEKNLYYWYVENCKRQQA